MHDGNVSTAAVVAGALWASVFMVGTVGLICALVGNWHAAVLVGLLDGVLAPIAAVAHGRYYAVRLAGIIRRLHGVEVDFRDGDRMRVR